jgi:hypothetical protein
MKISQEELLEDFKYSEIEKRGLQFLLTPSQQKGYIAWLKRPEAYRERVKSLNRPAAGSNTGGSSGHTGEL